MNKNFLALLVLLLLFVGCSKEKELKGPMTIRYEMTSSNSNGLYEFRYQFLNQLKDATISSPWSHEETIQTLPENTTYVNINFALGRIISGSMNDVLTLAVYVNGKLEKQFTGAPSSTGVFISFNYK